MPPVDPDQLLFDGRRHAEARVQIRATRRRSTVDQWASALDVPRTVAELAALWWPEVGEPRTWRVGSYPRRHLAAAWYRVRVMEAAGVAVVGEGCLKHRRQNGSVVMRAKSRGISAAVVAR